MDEAIVDTYQDRLERKNIHLRAELELHRGALIAEQEHMEALGAELAACREALNQLAACREALNRLVAPQCEWLHHEEEDLHRYDDPCPVVAMIQSARKSKGEP